MKAQTMLNKIMTLLSMKEEVELAYGQLKDGTILESNTFDVGETIDVVSEDGSKSPAPTGEHEIALKDSDGNEVIIRVLVAEGKITERSNIEEAAPMAPEESQIEIEKEMEMEVEIVPVENIPVLDDRDARIMALENKIMEMESMINEFKKHKMAAVEPDEEEVDVPVLDGAPIEENQVNLSSFKFKAKTQTTMDRVLQNISK